MTLRALVPVAAFVSVAFFGMAAPAADPEAKSLQAADLLPVTTVLYSEIAEPGRLLDLALDHPLHERLRELDEYQQALTTPQHQQLLLAVKMFEGAVDMRWRPALKLLTSGGVYLAADVETKGVALLVHAGERDKLIAVRDAALTLVRAQARQQGRDDPIKTGEYRGVPAHALPQVRIAIFGDWLLATNKDELGKAILDRYLDAGRQPGDVSCLGQNPQFQAARNERPEQALGWAYADLRTLREHGAAKKLFAGPNNNPVAELLLGGVLGVMQEASFASAALEGNQQQLMLTAALPIRAGALDEKRVYFFGPEGAGAAPPLVAARETVFTLSAYRDLAEFWASAPELFDENINAKFAEANSGLTTLFSGRDFGEEVLGAVGPELQLVVARQQLPQADLPAPKIKLPAFAVVFRLDDPAAMRRPLKVSFQSIVGFTNVVGAMNGQPQLETVVSQRDEAEIVSAAYLPPVDEEEIRDGLINYNFSPTAAFIGDVFLLASSKTLAEELADSRAAAPPGQATPEPTQVNTAARLNAAALRALVEDNQEQLIAQNMLEKGHTRQEAEREIGGLLKVLAWFRNSSLRLTHDGRRLRLQGSLEFAHDPAPASLGDEK